LRARFPEAAIIGVVSSPAMLAKAHAVDPGVSLIATAFCRRRTYHAILTTAGATVDLWETTYFHALSGPDPVLDWLKGATLLPVQAALSGAGTKESVAFERVLAERPRAAYPPDARGVTLFPFKRLFLIGSR
jgi:trans-aconitate methyltransferase